MILNKNINKASRILQHFFLISCTFFGDFMRYNMTNTNFKWIPQLIRHKRNTCSSEWYIKQRKYKVRASQIVEDWEKKLILQISAHRLHVHITTYKIAGSRKKHQKFMSCMNNIKMDELICLHHQIFQKAHSLLMLYPSQQKTNEKCKYW